MKKSTHSESRSPKNLWGLMKPSKATAASQSARRTRKQPARGFGARAAAREKDNSLLAKILRTLKLKKD